MSGTNNSIIEVDIREGRGIPVRPPGPGPGPGPTPPGPPNPSPGWNGIPGSPGGTCEDNLMVDLTITMNFGSMMDALNQCQRMRAENEARAELIDLYYDDEDGIEPLSGRPLKEMWGEEWKNIPQELIVNHLRILMKKGYEHCANDLVCPILWSAMSHHEKCKHKTIVVKIPSRLIQEIEDYRCWKEFEDFLERDGVDWMMLPV